MVKCQKWLFLGFLAFLPLLSLGFIRSSTRPESIVGGFSPEPVISPVLKDYGIANFNKEPEKWRIIEMIYNYSILYGADFNLCLDLAIFESGLNPLAKNKKSTAKGIYQFINKTFKDFCEGDVYNAEDNIRCGIKLLSEGGLSHWTIDKKVKKHLTLLGYLKWTRRN